MERESASARALPLLLLAGVCFSTLDATAKYLVRDLSLFVVVFSRYAGQMLVVTPIAWHRVGPGFWRTRNLRIQLLRSVLLVGATACFFGGLRYLPLAEGSAITFLAPILATLLSGPVLGERPTRARWIASIAGFLGILVLVRPGSAVFHPAAALLVGAAACNALYQLLTRKLGGDSPHTTLFYSGLVGSVLLSLALPCADMPAQVPAGAIALLLVLGVLGGLGHGLLTTAFLRAPATLLAPFMYLQVIWATLLGWIVFGQLPDGISALGMAVIVASGVGLVLHERRSTRPLAAPRRP